MPRIAAVGAAALVLTGCGSSAPPPAPEPTFAPGEHGSLAACLREHGVPESAAPGAALGPPAGVDQPIWQEAMRACADFAPGPATP